MTAAAVAAFLAAGGALDLELIDRAGWTSSDYQVVVDALQIRQRIEVRRIDRIVADACRSLDLSGGVR